MRAGWLRHRITIQRREESLNDLGEPVGSWLPVITLWGSVQPLRGDERDRQQVETAMLTTKIICRDTRQTVIRPDMRAVWNGHIYDIHEVIRPYEKKRDMELMCSEVINAS